MGLALVDAAREAGLRIALLDTLYLTSGIGTPAAGVQLRFSDGSAEAWQERADELTADLTGDVVVGAAIHSVRAVPLSAMRLVAEWADRFETPLHVHLSEQVAENEDCLAAYGRTPTEVLAEAGALTDRTTVVHATHLTELDVDRLGAAGCFACFCPTTERDLGDGVGPSRPLLSAGARLTVGSDSHAVVDPFEEMRAVELDERLTSQARGHWSAAELLAAATVEGHSALGFRDAGRIERGQRADLVTLDLGSPRTAGCGATPETAVFAAGAADVVQVVAGGRVVHRAEDTHDVGAALDRVLRRLWAAS
jgi:formiminoglutamate deiminase